MRMDIAPAPFYPGRDFFTGYELPLRVIHVENGPAYPLHEHGFHELVIVGGGTALHLFEGTELETRPGDVFLVPKGASHGYVRPERFDYVNVIFASAALGDDDRDGTIDLFNGCFRARLSRFELREAMALVNGLDAEIHQLRPGSVPMASAWFTLLRGTIARRIGADRPAGESASARVERVVAYLRGERTSDPSVEDMAAEAGMGVRHFHRVFKSLAGRTPTAFKHEQRIERACALLLGTDMTASQIASLVGYDDGTYFARQFKRIKGLSPLQFRAAASRA